MKKTIALLLLSCMLFSSFAFPGAAATAAFEPITPALSVSAFTDAQTDGGVWRGEGGEVVLDGTYAPSENGKGFSAVQYGGGKYSTASGIRFSNRYLGEGDFTVEILLAPFGLADNETGGAYYSDRALPVSERAFILGGLRGKALPARSALYHAEDMGVFWYYGQESEPRTWDSALDAVAFGDIVSYRISCENTPDGQVYRIYVGDALADVIPVERDDLLPIDPQGEARFFYGIPATVYAVRVYHCLLTEKDRNTAHFADICAYAGVKADAALSLLDSTERERMEREGARLAVGASAHKIGALLSSYLEAEDLGAETTADFFRVASYYRLDLLGYLSSSRKGEICALIGSLPEREDVEGAAAQVLLDSFLGGPPLAETVLTFAGFSVPEGETLGVSAGFSLSASAVKLLEEMGYTLRVGAVVGLAATHADASSLEVNHKGGAEEEKTFSFLAYRTGGKAQDFRYTVQWDNEKYCDRKGYKHDILFRGYVILTDSSGKCEILYTEAEDEKNKTPSLYSLADYFVQRFEGERADKLLYNGDVRLRGVLTKCGVFSIPTYATEEDILLATLQKQLADGLEAAKNVTQVRYCGRSYTGFREESIWVEYLNGTFNGDSRIRPAYIYFPCKMDPSKYTAAEKEANGIRRVFCYIGMPEGTGEVPGLVCVHGGGGHAYGRYAAEAVNHGYASIAIDTDGYTREDPNAPDGGNYVLDSLGVKKDSLSTTREAMDAQWMYYVQRALIYANTVLRAQERVVEDEVGITGISWGGFCTTIAIGYDDRYAFAVPVYISGCMDESVGLSLSGLPQDAFAAALWQNRAVLSGVNMPVLILNSDRDYFSSLNANEATCRLMPNASMCIIPALGHSQESGATVPEIYAFGDYITGRDSRLLTMDRTVTAALGRQYTVRLSSNLTERTAYVFYLTEPIRYNGRDIIPTWQVKELTVGEDGSVSVEVPEEACLYYLVTKGFSAADKKTFSAYGKKYDGFLSTTSDLIAIGAPSAQEK